MYEIYLKLLKEKGVKTADVCRATGIVSSTFSDWKKGKSAPKQDKLMKIANYFNVSLEYLMTGKESDTNAEPALTARDERDIAKDLENIMRKLDLGENGPASYDGEEIPEDDREMFAGQLEIMLRRLKAINKEKYNPKKNQK